MSTRRLWSLALTALVILSACAGVPSSLDADAGHAASVSTPAALSSETPDETESVQPVYPVSPDGGFNPLAERLCHALHDLPVARRGACCASRAPASPFSECARNVSAAVELGAVTLREADVDRCVHALERSLEGCDWAPVTRVLNGAIALAGAGWFVLRVIAA